MKKYRILLTKDITESIVLLVEAPDPETASDLASDFAHDGEENPAVVIERDWTTDDDSLSSGDIYANEDPEEV